LSLEGRELKAKSRILRRHGRMTAEEEPRKTNQEQGEGRHRPRFLGHMPMKVKPLSANRILANHNANPERSPEEEEEIRREVDAVRATAKKEGRNYAVVYCRPPQERGEHGRVYDKPERG
jgi:hypothetical protein